MGMTEHELPANLREICCLWQKCTHCVPMILDFITGDSIPYLFIRTRANAGNVAKVLLSAQIHRSVITQTVSLN